MPRLRISEFHGEFPKLNRRRIPVGGAQKARNVRFDSGDLRPFQQPADETILQAGDIGYIFWYRHQDDASGLYIAFGDDYLVHGFRSPVPDDQFRRWYWNVSQESMRYISNPKNPSPASAAASVGTGKAFRQFKGIRVGIPAPQITPESLDVTPESAVGHNSQVGITSVARTNPMTVNTAEPHGLKAGWRVRISIDESLPKPQDDEGDGEGLPEGGEGETSTIGQIWALEGAEGIVSDVTDLQFDITGISATSFQEFDQEDIDALRVERVVTDNEKESRSYVWTYVSQFGEEGPPSKPSNIIDVPKVGAVVEVEIGDTAHNPTVNGGSRDFINRIRLYRSVGGNTDTPSLFVGELQFSGSSIPDDAVNVEAIASQANGPFTDHIVLALEEDAPPEYQVGDSIKLRATSDPSFQFDTTILELLNVGPDGLPGSLMTDLTLDDIPTSVILDPPEGMYISRGFGVFVDGEVAWTSPPNSVPALAWSAVFNDSVLPINLGRSIKSQGWFPPPNKMLGIALMANGVIAGWRGNSIFFSDRHLPHAWDPDYTITVEDEIIGGQSYGNVLVIGTRSRPYIVTGIDPASMSAKKVEFHAPLIAKEAIVDAGFGVMYMSHDGLVLISGSGPKYLTEGHFTEQEWLKATEGRNRVAFYDGIAFVYGRNRRILVLDAKGGRLEVSEVELDIGAATPKEGELAIVENQPASGQYRTIRLFKKDSTAWMTGTFQSSMVSFRRPVNPAAAQVFSEGYPVTLRLRYVRPSSFPDPESGQPDLDILAEDTYTVDGPEPFWLNDGYLTREFEFEIETGYRVQEVLIATSINELRSV